MVKVGRITWELGLNSLKSGNISVLMPNRDIVITKTGKSLRDLHVEDDLTIVPQTKTDRGDASGEFYVHRGIYQASACGRGAILHCHPLHTIAASSIFESGIPPAFNEGRDVLGTTKIVESRNSENLGEDPTVIGRILCMDKVIVVRGHGTFALAERLEQCLYLTHLLENNCRILFLEKEPALQVATDKRSRVDDGILRLSRGAETPASKRPSHE